MTWIKICGITSPEDADHAIRCGADAIGLIFATSQREVSVDRAREIAAVVRGRAHLVGVFKSVDVVEAIHRDVRLDRIQIHDARELRVDVPVLRAIRPEQIGETGIVREGETTLIDGSEGRGRAFDWTLAKNTRRPFVLAGGLTPDNVPGALEALRPDGVDVTSGVEAQPGVKDAEKVRRFCDTVRNFDARH